MILRSRYALSTYIIIVSLSAGWFVVLSFILYELVIHIRYHRSHERLTSPLQRRTATLEEVRRVWTNRGSSIPTCSYAYRPPAATAAAGAAVWAAKIILQAG